MNAALPLSPYPKPSHTPAPRAMMFFRLPPSSTPTTSVLVYTRNIEDMNISWALTALPSSRQATTVEAGLPSMISLARLGPERTQTPLWNDPGSSSSRISLMRLADSFSRPLAALSTRQGRDRKGARPRTFSRRLWDGTTMTIMSTSGGLFSGRCDAQVRREGVSGQPSAVLTGGLHFLGLFIGAGPQQRVDAVVGKERGQGRPPAGRPDYGRSGRHTLTPRPRARRRGSPRSTFSPSLRSSPLRMRCMFSRCLNSTMGVPTAVYRT